MKEDDMAGNTIQVLYHGYMEIDRDLLIANPNTFLTQSNRESSKVLCQAPSFTYLIRSPDGKTMLYDATIHKNWEQEWHPEWKELANWKHSEEEMFENTLKKQKLGPEDIDYVLLSHLHVDHAGNARIFATTDTELLVHDDEFTDAAAREADGNFFLRVDYDIPGANYSLLPGDTEIMKGVRAISLPGHTAGTMGLFVETERSGNIIITSDACYMKDSYDLEAGSPISANLEIWKRSMKKLKMFARAHNATILFGHDHAVCHEGHTPINDETQIRRDRLYD
jgi:glyoxylase-like metal-dependent hydrolase (beta-lactamase superfamily II)